MRGIEPLFASPVERRMTGDERAVLEDADRTGQYMDVQNPPTRRVRHAVQIAADADHAFVRYPTFEPEHRLVRRKRERPQGASFLGEGLVHDPAGCRMHARIGDRIEPLPQLDVEVFEVPERAGEEEVLADIA